MSPNGVQPMKTLSLWAIALLIAGAYALSGCAKDPTSEADAKPNISTANESEAAQAAGAAPPITDAPPPGLEKGGG